MKYRVIAARARLVILGLMSLKVLVTGFEPFGGSPRNPSGEVALALDGRRIFVDREANHPSAAEPSAIILGRRLPVLWGEAGRALVALVEELRPAIVIALGMAEGTFRVEQMADDVEHNLMDNAGKQPPSPRRDPTARFPTALPYEACERAIAALGCPVEESSFAGGFICGDLFNALMRTYHADRDRLGLLRAGFVHVPNDRHIPSRIPSETLEAAIVSVVSVVVRDVLDRKLDKG